MTTPSFITHTRDFRVKLQHKLKTCRTKDAEVFATRLKKKGPSERYPKFMTLDQATLLIYALKDDTCPDCSCTMLFCNYEPYCVYQFAFTLKDKDEYCLPDNIVVKCYRCATCGPNSVKFGCPRACHI